MSQFRRVVTAPQGIAFAVALTPIVPADAARACLAGALALLTVWSGRDVVQLERVDQR